MSRATSRSERFAALALAWTAAGVALAEEPASKPSPGQQAQKTSLERAPAHFFVREFRLVLLERLAEVILDPHQGVQPRHRLLKDETEIGAAQPAEIARRHRHEVAALVQHLAVRTRALR